MTCWMTFSSISWYSGLHNIVSLLAQRQICSFRRWSRLAEENSMNSVSLCQHQCPASSPQYWYVQCSAFKLNLPSILLFRENIRHTCESWRSSLYQWCRKPPQRRLHDGHQCQYIILWYDICKNGGIRQFIDLTIIEQENFAWGAQGFPERCLYV